MSRVLLLAFVLFTLPSPAYHDEAKIKQLEQRVSQLEEWVVYLIAVLQHEGILVPPDASATPTPQTGKCPTCQDIEWTVAQYVAKKWELHIADVRVANYVNRFSSLYSTAPYFCSRYKALGHPITNFTKGWSDIATGMGTRYRRAIYCAVRASLSEQDLYFFRDRFERRRSVEHTPARTMLIGYSTCPQVSRN